MQLTNLIDLTDYVRDGEGNVLFRNNMNGKWFLIVDKGDGNNGSKIANLTLYTDYKVNNSAKIVSNYRKLLINQYYEDSNHKDSKEYLSNYSVITDTEDTELKNFVEYVLEEIGK